MEEIEFTRSLAYPERMEKIETWLGFRGFSLSEDELEAFASGPWLDVDWEQLTADDPPQAQHDLARAYYEYVDYRDFDGDESLTLDDVIEVMNDADVEPDALEEYIETQWVDLPDYPFCFYPMSSDRLFLCVTNRKEVVADLIAYEHLDEFIEFEEGYVHKKTDEYLAELIEDARILPYAEVIESSPDDAFTWFDCDTPSDEHDFETDRYCFKGTKVFFDRENMPVEYMVENAYDTVLTEGDCLARVVRVPTRAEVLERFEKLPLIEAEYSDYPYCLSNNWVSILEPEKVYSSDDLMTYVALELLDSTTNGLIEEAMSVDDPVEYVAQQLNLALQTRALMKMPLITLDDVGGAMERVFDIFAKKSRRKSKRRKPATMREKIIDAALGRK